MRAGFNIYASPAHTGYIGGTGDGIVTIAGQAASRPIYLLNVDDLQPSHFCVSLSNGHYLFMGLDPSKEYVVFARDHMRNYEPAAYDYVRPTTDRTYAEQDALWQQMLSS